MEKVDGGSPVKKLMTICELIHYAFKKHGIPQIAVEGHVLVPATARNPLTGGTFSPHFRFQVTGANQVHCFHPDPPSTEDKAKLRHTEIGSLCAGWIRSKNDNANIVVAWEVQIETNPPASVRPMKPKVWLQRPLNVEPGFLYKVA